MSHSTVHPADQFPICPATTICDKKSTGLICHILPFAEHFFAFMVLSAEDAGEGEIKGTGRHVRDLLLVKGDAGDEAMCLKLWKIAVVAASAVA